MKQNTMTEQELREYAGNLIKVKREAKGLSIEQLAEAAEISFKRIKNFENGTSDILVTDLYFIGRVLEIQLPQFFGVEGSVNEIK